MMASVDNESGENFYTPTPGGSRSRFLLVGMLLQVVCVGCWFLGVVLCWVLVCGVGTAFNPS